MLTTYATTLTTKEQLVGDVWRFEFTLDEGQLDIKAGQYLLLKIGEFYRQYSISSPPSHNKSFEIIIEYIPKGIASLYLSQLQVGQKAEFRGPAGVFILRDTPKDKIFLGTGTGIAPIKAMIQHRLSQQVAQMVTDQTNPLVEPMHRLNDLAGSPNLYLFFGLRYRQDVYLFDIFKKLAEEHKNFHFKLCLSREQSLEGLDGNHYVQGRVNAHIETLLQGKNPNDFEYYICGGRQTVDSLRAFVEGFGVLKENISFEIFT
ncbi:hypothetical protein A3H80_00800 [Candidatus Roizmanbacteria bacterium RIFCSPLOWO2_02_FULL_37_19]|uniref:FAD-binding FR-type domain-containing protein n=1 Tax=Candidatus Roizmanbacteria bacterium RIFCSPHIGHO2_02_FULL_37_24 TaxID=1802037 RepID=A0A1F7GVR4_9BACT|nr:MAG: hypothetical protein A2862_00485 [Candidatus Roizmanbacteria bacterium RIFCSPHIGHO2_01_FULL_38_41]OGK22676.1 MAG: hypothetical protein A3C24_00605 [Candidatus Roizmanbacteria bacterium RIFCSPHIGHO2_02_FULL_37_24]OGK32526.1 MAG: hypothetical protein A3E10_00670 [Candidatus Roizmanbacteria bacterium RIFCSPHIGHO2_12_FULL_37_23]OGK43730.1 MAG: hypothetical protein A2956_01370 [Candidatus Roizmanbacteria bacterium RIFCSPLOWO2_01_FULL_37_57]OGK54506.1 MAG: hypothetical protein A3H80_00800 [Ca